MDELTPTEQAILAFLKTDAATCGKVYHFDPYWMANELDLYELELRTAARQLASRGLISIHEFRQRITDIALLENSSTV